MNATPSASRTPPDSPALALARTLIARRSVTPNDDNYQPILTKQLAQLGFNIEHLRRDQTDNL